MLSSSKDKITKHTILLNFSIATSGIVPSGTSFLVPSVFTQKKTRDRFFNFTTAIILQGVNTKKKDKSYQKQNTEVSQQESPRLVGVNKDNSTTLRSKQPLKNFNKEANIKAYLQC